MSQYKKKRNNRNYIKKALSTKRTRGRRVLLALLALFALLAAACGISRTGLDLSQNKQGETGTESASGLTGYFTDAQGGEFSYTINEAVEKTLFDPTGFQLKGTKMTYQGANAKDYSICLGVDVSHHQEQIDWKKVKAAGYEFAIIRLGYRGYGQEGKICLDQTYEENIKGAKAAGLDVGVYFFSQAINEKEAKEEAQFVLKNLKNQQLSLPVVYDPESIVEEEARTDDVSGEQFTKNSKVFCQEITDAGYQAMIYSNMSWEAYQLDLSQLSDYPVWYADYQAQPQTPYAFQIWQYSESGSVDGISGKADVNIMLK